MKIEVLYVPNCPNHAVALSRIRRVMSAEGFQAQVNQILVEDPAMARSLRFPGSPTVRVNGLDVEPQTQLSFGLMCRLYSDGSGAPSQESLRLAIKNANGV
jgi:hypothetical protein